MRVMFVIIHQYSIMVMYRWRDEYEIARLVSSASTLDSMVMRWSLGTTVKSCLIRIADW